MLARLLSSLALLVAPAVTGSGPEAARSAYQQGLTAIQDGRARAARELLLVAAREAPTWVLPRVALAELALVRNEDLERAHAALVAVAQFGADNPRVHRVLGDIAQARGREREAADAWGRSLALSFDPEVSARRAATLVRLAQHAEAADEYGRYLQRRPDEHHLRARRAAELEAAGRTAEARAELELLARLQPDAVAPARQLARFLERHGEPGEAAAAHAAADQRAGGRRSRNLRALPPSRW